MVLLVVLGTWENQWITRCYKETTLSGNNSINFFPGWVLNSRFRGAVRSSVIIMGVSLHCQQSKHSLCETERQVSSLMSGVFPYVNIKSRWHLVLNLLRKVPLHAGDSITFQAWLLPCHTSRSSLYMTGMDLGNVTISELFWLSSPTWSQCLSWALSKRQRYVLTRQYTHSPFPQPSVPLLGKSALLRASTSTALWAWPSLTPNLNLSF